MRFISVCSGIEAASVAWNPLGWKAAMFSEIEPFPCSVLAHHYPTVPNRGDMTKFEDWPDDSVDLLCGGTPCQSFSVAGLRKGLDDPRGNLMLTYGAIAAKHRPRWLVWENVPGVLSSNGGRDFGSFLGLLGQLGYGFAYRVLDAQHFGVPQRRRRVFVVGCLGDWRAAAAVLLERHSLSGHPAPSREAGQRIAATLTRGAESSGKGGYAGRRREDDVNLVSMCLNAKGGAGRLDAESETLIPINGGHFGVAHALTGEGFDASEDGTGRGTPLVPVLPFDTTQMTSAANRSQPKAGDPCHPLAAGAHAPAIAFSWQGGGTQTTLGYDPDSRVAGTLVKDQTQAIAGSQVRRLTPMECERLQGFPDGYTAIPTSKRNAAAEHEEMRAYYLRTGQAVTDDEIRRMAADGPRYKALGNSWAVPCAKWIGERINAVEQITAPKELEAA
ncbi:DNA (cytosine-5-)-methyltransferase [Variovorax sp. GT1P44]|uniref:DNA (cytosine-5-)-methyltransferase n=1 Tax=Variovorax sp. GT1P44 TaxID=3443742 RepID=UPI003F48A26D